MKKNQLPKIWLTLILVFVPLTMMACIFDLSTPGGTEAPITDENTPVPHEFGDADFDSGTGPFNLSDPAAGLDLLSSYRATLTVTFNGQNNGSPENWSRSYEATVSRGDNPFVQLVIQSSGQMDGESLPNLYKAETNQTLYRQLSGEECTVEILSENSQTATGVELAQQIPHLKGADEAGTEEIDGVAAQHYTFDALAMGLSGLGTGTGEIWVAADGGSVLRYSASFEGGEEYFGAGAMGTITWEYDLQDIDQPVQLELPTGCPYGRLPVPLMLDAANVDEAPGETTYTTTSTAEAVIGFYMEQMPAAGWEVRFEPSISEDGGAVTFVHGEDQLSIAAFKTEEGTSVWLLLEKKLEPMPGG